MAVVCNPLSSREILQTEKENNVVIFRKIIYDRQAGYEALTNSLDKLRVPLKFFFIFGLNDCMLVSGAEEMQEALQRLVTI